MITRDQLDQAFLQQRELTSAAIDNGPGLGSYLRNLGVESQDLLGWAYDYACGNIANLRPEWDEDDCDFVASLLSRALAVGLIVGRQTKP